MDSFIGYMVMGVNPGVRREKGKAKKPVREGKGAREPKKGKSFRLGVSKVGRCEDIHQPYSSTAKSQAKP